MNTLLILISNIITAYCFYSIGKNAGLKEANEILNGDE